MPAGPGGISQQRREPQHPPVDDHVVDLDPTLGEELRDVAIRQAEVEIPADRQHDDVGWEAEAGEGGTRSDRPAGAVSGVLIAGVSPPRPPRGQRNRAGRDAAQRVSAPGGAGDSGAAVVCGQTGDQTGQESRSNRPRAAARVTAMDSTIHASFLPHNDPDASLAFSRDALGFQVRNNKPRARSLGE
jgi:hypothetical protein